MDLRRLPPHDSAYLNDSGQLRYPRTGDYYDRQATAQTSIPPKPTSQVARESVQMATYITVMVTCVAVLITLGVGWYEFFRIAAALNTLHNQISS